MTLSHPVAHRIPPLGPPSATGKSVLLVFLSEDKRNHDRITDHVRPWLEDVDIKPWRPSNYTLQTLTAQGKHRDSTANLYGLAILAHRAGWAHLLVADELTNRQISGNRRCGESADVSFVMVTVTAEKVVKKDAKKDAKKEAEKDAKKDAEDAEDASGEVQVIARRTTGPYEDQALYDTMQNLLDTVEFCRSEAYREIDIYYEFGLQLHDPDREICSPDTSRSLPREEYVRAVEQVLSGHKGLPAELTASIVSHADEGVLDERMYPPNLRPDEDGTRKVLLLRPMPEDDRVALQSAMREAVAHEGPRKSRGDIPPDQPFYNVSLVPCDTYSAGTRRELARFEKICCELLGKCETERNWVVKVPRLGEEGVVNVIMVINDEGRLPFCIMEPMDIVIPHLFGKGEGAPVDGPYATTSPSTNICDFEVLYDPAGPFCPYPPPFLPVDPRMNSVSVFCLTANLTPEEIRTIEEAILTGADGDNPEHSEKVCCIVPWEKTADGGLDEIWEIFWAITRQEILNVDKAYEDHYAPPYFFIDRQSVVDKKVIAIHTYEYNPRGDDYIVEQGLLMNVEDPFKRGFIYGRILPEETHLVRDNLTSGNMFFSELFDEPREVKKYLRPDWPGHGILHDDWSEEDYSEEEYEQEESTT